MIIEYSPIVEMWVAKFYKGGEVFVGRGYSPSSAIHACLKATGLFN